jgi:hypothetical protein
MSKMKNIILIILMLSLSIFSCSSEDQGVNGKKVIGKWYWSIQDKDIQVVNGKLYEGPNKLKIIEELEIFRSPKGRYTYRIKNSSYWEKYNNIPKIEYSVGRIDSQIVDSKWRFVSGDYGDHGGYVSVPQNEWNTDTVYAITVSFPKGRGREKLFTRKPIELAY